jgi:F-type H+-transporting ATPase subunit c
MRKLQYVFMAGGALLRRSGLRGWRLGRHQPGAHRRRHRHGAGCGSLRPRSGQGNRFGNEALARNPGARAGIQLLLVLGLAFIESLTLFTLVIIFARKKKRPLPKGWAALFFGDCSASLGVSGIAQWPAARGSEPARSSSNGLAIIKFAGTGAYCVISSVVSMFFVLNRMRRFICIWKRAMRHCFPPTSRLLNDD